MTITKDQVLEALAKLELPDGGGDIVSAGMVSAPFITKSDVGDKVMFSLTVPANKAQVMEPLRSAAQQVVESLDGVASAMVAMTAERKAGEGGSTPPPPAAPKAPEQPTAQPGIPGVKHIIAVASGKGGVGKSTTSINLALGLKNQGLKVGVLDADIYGPSLPRLLGLNGKPEAEGRVLKPMESLGLKVMSTNDLAWAHGDLCIDPIASRS